MMFFQKRYSLGPMRCHIGSAARKYFIGAGICAVLLGIGLRAFMPSVLAQGWEPAIRDFKDQNKENPPKPGSIFFTGISSFRIWDPLVSDMKPLDVINRGF